MTLFIAFQIAKQKWENICFDNAVLPHQRCGLCDYTREQVKKACGGLACSVHCPMYRATEQGCKDGSVYRRTSQALDSPNYGLFGCDGDYEMLLTIYFLELMTQEGEL